MRVIAIAVNSCVSFLIKLIGLLLTGDYNCNYNDIIIAII